MFAAVDPAGCAFNPGVHMSGIGLQGGRARMAQQRLRVVVTGLRL